MGAAHLLLQQKKGNVKYKLGNINQSLAPLALHIFVFVLTRDKKRVW